MKRGNTISQLPPGRYLWPDGRARLTPPPEVDRTTIAAPVPLTGPEPLPKGRQWAPYRNKTEALAAAWLRQKYPAGAEILRYEELKLCVGMIDGKPAYYTPDFVIPWPLVPWSIFEVKGGHRWRRHGIERLRAAAARWPMFDWFLMEPVSGGGFTIKEVEG